jgi:hypothetical protein
MLNPISDLSANIERLVEVATAMADRGQQNELLLKDMVETVKDMHQVMRGIQEGVQRLEVAFREQQAQSTGPAD